MKGLYCITDWISLLFRSFRKGAALLFLLGSLLSCATSEEENQLVTLQNEYLRVVAKSTGAELISVKQLAEDIEYLWQGDSITWSDHAIVQFPIIGNLKNNQYQLDSTTYHMMSHGFARINKFSIKEQTNNKVVFELKSNTSTEAIYPFEFTFEVSYELEKQSVKVSFKVLNDDDKKMYFSLGYHPGFNWPFKVGERLEDYYLEFSEKEFADRLIMKNNLIDRVEPNYLSDTNSLYLSKALFQEDAIILKNISSTGITLKNHINTKAVNIQFGKIPYLGIWSPKRFGNFVCIEPWFGIPDARDATGNFKEKEGIVQLNKSESFDWTCTITIY